MRAMHVTQFCLHLPSCTRVPLFNIHNPTISIPARACPKLSPSDEGGMPQERHRSCAPHQAVVRIQRRPLHPQIRAGRQAIRQSAASSTGITQLLLTVFPFQFVASRDTCRRPRMQTTLPILSRLRRTFGAQACLRSGAAPHLDCSSKH